MEGGSSFDDHFTHVRGRLRDVRSVAHFTFDVRFIPGLLDNGVSAYSSNPSYKYQCAERPESARAESVCVAGAWLLMVADSRATLRIAGQLRVHIS